MKTLITGHRPLKLIIKEEVVRATKDGTFGSYLFGQQRNLPSSKNPEPNTDDEQDLFDDLMSHYEGGKEHLEKWLDYIISLNKQGKYQDILKVPAEYKYAYRTMSNVDYDTLVTWLGHDPEDMKSGKVYREVISGIIQPQTTKHMSWTVNPSAFKAMIKDWDGLSYDSSGYLVFLRAPIEGNTFLLNPNQTKAVSGHYHKQKEVISVGPVTFDNIWFVSLHSENEQDDYDAERERLLGIDKRSAKHISDYVKASKKP